MDLVTLLRKGKPAELREIGEMLVGLAAMPRDAGTAAIIEATVAKFADPREFDLAAVLNAARRRSMTLHDALIEDGMTHSALLAAELERRGDARTVEEYVVAQCGGYLRSDL